MAGELLVECPNCGAKAGEPCTAATGPGRMVVTWFHVARTDRAKGWT